MPRVALPPLVRDLHAAGVPVRSAEVTRPTLDDVFLALTGRSLREGHSGTSDQPTHTEPDRGGLRMSTATLTR